MAIQVEMPEKVEDSGGNWLKEAGRYHFIVTATSESPLWPNGQPIDGFKIEAVVVGGNEAEKKMDFIFKNTLPTWSDKGKEMNNKKRAACMIALGFVTPENMGKTIDVELSKAVDRHFVAEVDFEKDDDGNDKISEKGNKFLQLAWSNIYHIDDPAAKNYPRNEAALKHLPASHRITDPTFFDLIRGKKPAANGSGNGHAKAAAKPEAPKRETTAAAASSVSSDPGDL